MTWKDKLRMWALCFVAVVAGPGVLERLLHPYHPCPRCGGPVKQWAQACQVCRIQLHWVTE